MRLSILLPALTGVAALAFTPVIALGAPQTPPSAPVTVVNTTANPVPVNIQGGVSGLVQAIQNLQNSVDALQQPRPSDIVTLTTSFNACPAPATVGDLVDTRIMPDAT